MKKNTNTWLNSGGHTNQLAYDKEKNSIILSSGRSEVTVVDVKDPKNCILKGSYGDINNNLGTWGMTYDNSKVYALYIESIVPFRSNWSGIKCINIK